MGQDNQPNFGGEERAVIAVLSMDSRGVNIENVPMGNLVRLELEKTQRYEVMDKYDVAYELEKEGIDPASCFGKNQLVDVGKMLGADNMLTGSVEKFGDKIIYTLRLIDVRQQRIEKTTVLEFVYQLEDIQTMTKIMVNDLLGIPNDQLEVEMLINFERPITNSKTSLSLNGPRFGVQFYDGEIASRLMADRQNGGFGLNNPVTSTFGYQHEVQYISAGDFQALFEFIGTINNIETGMPGFSLTILNGMRYDGWEIGFGPSFRIAKMAEGAYDSEGVWRMASELTDPGSYDLMYNLDSRGDIRLNTGLIVAAGRTFSSGYLNFPVNVYWSPSTNLNSNIFGVMLGFNIAKRPRREPNN